MTPLVRSPFRKILASGLFAFVILGELGGTPAASATDSSPLFAAQVGYFSVRLTGPADYYYECYAKDPTRGGQIALAHGTEYELGIMRGGITSFDQRTSQRGHVVMLGDQKLEYEPREESGYNGWTNFRVAGGASGEPGAIMHVAWAVWAGEVDCEAWVNDIPVDIRYFDGSHALYAGPEAFSGGLFYQDGSRKLAAARVFSRSVSGGALFAYVTRGKTGAAMFMSDDPEPLNPVWECHTVGNTCSYARPHPSMFVVSLNASFEDDPRGFAGELWEIDVPKVEPTELSPG